MFLRTAALCGIAGGVALIDRLTQPLGPVTYYRWLLRGNAVRLSSQPSIVATARCPTYDAVAECLPQLWAAAGMPEVAGKRVLLKPNLIEEISGHPIATNAAVIVGVAQHLRRLGASEVAVGDGSGFLRSPAPVLRETGLGAALASIGVPFIDLNHDDPSPVAPPDAWFPGESRLWLPRHILEADLVVSVPKQKTHHWAGVSLSLKNLFGVLPGCRYGWPKNMLHLNGIPRSVLGLHEALPRVVGLVDGVIGMEGDGPLFGTPVAHGMLAASADCTALDTVCAAAMGFRLEEVPYLTLARFAGVGHTDRIEVRGVPVEDLVLPYEPAPRPSAG
jgi:uncharacterized protein (DUF362 family)